MMKSLPYLALLATMISVSYGSDWLEGGNVMPGSSEGIQQYFTDPIFFTKVPISTPVTFHPAQKRPTLLREPLYLGKYAVKYQWPNQVPSDISVFPSSPWQSEFRNSSLAAMEWDPVQTNWTGTLDLARAKSSVKVFQNGVWTSI